MTKTHFGQFFPNPFSRFLIRLSQSQPANWLGRRLSLVLRKIHLKTLSKLVDYSVDGINFRFHLDDNVGERKYLFMPQFFDVFERDLINHALNPHDVFIDIGANAGIYTLSAAKNLGADGIVIAIEPNPIMVERLKFNIHSNDIDPTIHIEEVGVSDIPGTFPLYLDPGNLGGSSLSLHHSGERIEIDCRTLEFIVRKHAISHIRMLKIDIEGAEDRALAPYFEAVDPSLYPDFIIMEDSSKHWNIDLLALLSSYGYSTLNKTRMNLVLELHRRNE